jgi:hypothetical protein
MTEHEASRTLVKSPPELWAECSDATSLARHLSDFFGEIRITRLEPETAVAWEGERARGTVRLEPAGWGTKVVLTATAVAPADEVPVAEPVAGPPVGDVPAPAASQAPGPPVSETPAETETPASVPPAREVTPTSSSDAPATTTVPRRRPFARIVAFLLGPEPPARAPEPRREPEAHETPPRVEVQPELADSVAEAPATGVADSVAEAPATGVADSVAEAPATGVAEAPATGVADSVTEAPTPEAGDPVAEAPADTQEALAAALDSLGQAHHRPYSRA